MKDKVNLLTLELTDVEVDVIKKSLSHYGSYLRENPQTSLIYPICSDLLMKFL